MDPVTWLLSTPMIPLLRSIYKNRNNPPETIDFIMGVYGYPVACGVVFNLMILIVAFVELLV